MLSHSIGTRILLRAFRLEIYMMSFCRLSRFKKNYFLLFSFLFVFMLSLKPRSFVLVQSFFDDMHAPRQSHVFLPFPLFLFLWGCRFFGVFF